MADGSQYDGTFPWDQDALLRQLEEALAAVEAAPLTEKDERRAVAESYRHDLSVLHGIDLGPLNG